MSADQIPSLDNLEIIETNVLDDGTIELVCQSSNDRIILVRIYVANEA